jgi:hypothetical protein
MASWHNQYELICLGSAAISTLIAYLLLRPFKRQQLVGRLPLFLVTGGAVLFFAVVNLPEATPHFFERLLGHSLSDMVTRQLSGGVTMSEDWLTFWGESVGTAFHFIILVSVLWAIVNLLRRTAVWSNVITLMMSFGWYCIYVWASVARFPF